MSKKKEHFYFISFSAYQNGNLKQRGYKTLALSHQHLITDQNLIKGKLDCDYPVPDIIFDCISYLGYFYSESL